MHDFHVEDKIKFLHGVCLSVTFISKTKLTEVNDRYMLSFLKHCRMKNVFYIMNNKTVPRKIREILSSVHQFHYQ
jgi:hypothetical protein